MHRRNLGSTVLFSWTSLLRWNKLVMRRSSNSSRVQTFCSFRLAEPDVVPQSCFLTKFSTFNFVYLPIDNHRFVSFSAWEQGRKKDGESGMKAHERDSIMEDPTSPSWSWAPDTDRLWRPVNERVDIKYTGSRDNIYGSLGWPHV